MEKDYEVVCTLGEGSFGKVYKARHRRSGDEVAVKQIKIGSRSWDEACRSTELQALKALRHAFIVKLKELIRGQKDGSLYYIFDFLDSDLCRLLKYNPNGLEEIRAATLIRQLFAGLTHMHQHCYFHRDIKPENILLDTLTESIRIADFGQARSLRALPPFTDYVGTRWYRAPECLLRDRSYSSPVDIWASGLIFAELLRGSPVFCGNSSIDQLYKIFTVLGPPGNDWPDFARLTQALRFRIPDRSCGLARVLPQCTQKCVAFISEILVANPRRRPVAKKCLEHQYFSNLPPLDLIDAQASRASIVDIERSDTPSQLPSVGHEDVFEFNERTPSKESRRESKDTTICEDLAADLDLDAELDAILGDSANGRADMLLPPSASPPKRAYTRSSSLPNLKPKQNMSQSRSSECIKRGFAVPVVMANCTTVAVTPAVATAEDHLDRLLESLDIAEKDADNDRLAWAGKIEIDRLPTVTVAKNDTDRFALGARLATEKVETDAGVAKPLPLVPSCAPESNADCDVRKQKDAISAHEVSPAPATKRTIHSDADLKRSNYGIGCLERAEYASPFLQANSTKAQSKRPDLVSDHPRAGHEELRELVGSKSLGAPLDLRNGSRSSAALDNEELRSASLKYKPWSADEAKRLRKVVKSIVRKGSRDKTVLWTEVSLELANGRTPKECKSQYARDYKAHRAKAEQEAFVEGDSAI